MMLILTKKLTGSLQIDIAKAYTDANRQSLAESITKAEAVIPQSSLISTIRAFHGVVLGGSFMVLFPIGAIIIHVGKLKQAFAYHWICQLGITIFCLATVLVGLIFSENAVDVSSYDVLWKFESNGCMWNQFRNFHEPHQILGTFLLGCLILQIGVGYWHHINYLQFKSRTNVSYAHIWMGRFVLVFGIVNTRL
jgi:hypothetical protein